jgi:hypothetical protein
VRTTARGPRLLTPGPGGRVTHPPSSLHTHEVSDPRTTTGPPALVARRIEHWIGGLRWSLGRRRKPPIPVTAGQIGRPNRVKQVRALARTLENRTHPDDFPDLIPQAFRPRPFARTKPGSAVHEPDSPSPVGSARRHARGAADPSRSTRPDDRRPDAPHGVDELPTRSAGTAAPGVTATQLIGSGPRHHDISGCVARTQDAPAPGRRITASLTSCAIGPALQYDPRWQSTFTATVDLAYALSAPR